MQFDSDWPGIFIRGDDALGYARALRALYQQAEQRAKSGQLDSTEAALWTRAETLAALLESCRVTDFPNS